MGANTGVIYISTGAKMSAPVQKAWHWCKNVCTGAYKAPVFAPIPPVSFLFFSQSRLHVSLYSISIHKERTLLLGYYNVKQTVSKVCGTVDGFFRNKDSSVNIPLKLFAKSCSHELPARSLLSNPNPIRLMLQKYRLTIPPEECRIVTSGNTVRQFVFILTP